HPLVRWFETTHARAPQSLNRVPIEIRQSDRSDEAIELLRAVGVEQEMALPLVLRGGEYVVLSLNRPGAKDFFDEEMQTAARIQPLLIAIWCQARVLEHCVWAESISAHELTGRERAVLQLLATGSTAEAIGRVLGCSGRTVEKHIEHLYRKLRVSDRVSAVRVGYEDGLLADHFGT
ncbi:MAG: LuxR C-terminal-related transcriptional regulator, partial [Mycetocola sp.]